LVLDYGAWMSALSRGLNTTSPYQTGFVGAAAPPITPSHFCWGQQSFYTTRWACCGSCTRW